jgi:RNA polymerase sigma-70 factor (sigma-E family)
MRDEATYIAFVETRWPALLRLAHLLTGSQQTGEDVLQGVLLKVYLGWGGISRVESPDGYVRRMLVNATISRGRTQARRGERLVDVVPEPPSYADDTVDSRLALWQAVRSLPARQRAVIVLRYYEDLSEAEIARVLGCAPGTVKSQASDALRSLRAVLGDSPFAETSGVHHDHA